MNDSDYVDLCATMLYEAESAWWARNWLQDRGLTDFTIRDYKLGYDPDRHAVVIPYLTGSGDIRCYRWRNLRPGAPKYMQPAHVNIHLFHVKVTRQPKVWLTEGEFDAMLLDQMGYPAVGVAGTNGFKEEWVYLFAYCDMVTVVFDGDDAGREGSQRITRLLSPYVSTLRTVRMPDKKDVTDLYRENKQALIKLVA